MPSAYREVLPCSRSASCSACAPGRSQPCYSSQSPFVGNSVGGPRQARIVGKRPLPTRSGTRVAVFPSVRGGTRRDARERPPTAPAAWFPRVTTRPDQLINAPQSPKPRGVFRDAPQSLKPRGVFRDSEPRFKLNPCRGFSGFRVFLALGFRR